MKKAAGLAGIIIFMSIYAMLAAAMGGQIAMNNPVLGLLYFAIAGIAWILPLRPLIHWLSRD